MPPPIDSSLPALSGAVHAEVSAADAKAGARQNRKAKSGVMKFDPTVNMGSLLQAATIVGGLFFCNAALKANVEYLRKDFDRAVEDIKQHSLDIRTLEKSHISTAADIRYIKDAVSAIQSHIDSQKNQRHQ